MKKFPSRFTSSSFVIETSKMEAFIILQIQVFKLISFLSFVVSVEVCFVVLM